MLPVVFMPLITQMAAAILLSGRMHCLIIMEVTTLLPSVILPYTHKMAAQDLTLLLGPSRFMLILPALIKQLQVTRHCIAIRPAILILHSATSLCVLIQPVVIIRVWGCIHFLIILPAVLIQL